MKPVALLGVGAGTPDPAPGRLPTSAAAWGSGGGRGVVGVCDADEDTLTLAWQAAVEAPRGRRAGHRSGVGGLWWGTSRPPMAEGPSHAFLAGALGLEPSAGGALCAGSSHAGMEALSAAWDALAAGHATVALVIASDALVPGPGTAAEAVTGAGAAAFVLGAIDSERTAGPSSNGSSPPARLVARVTRAMPALDRYRPDASPYSEDVYDARLFREKVFVPLLAETGRALTADGASVAGWALSDPDGKLATAVAKRLGAPLVSGAVTRALGDTGAAAATARHACRRAPRRPTSVGRHHDRHGRVRRRTGHRGGRRRRPGRARRRTTWRGAPPDGPPRTSRFSGRATCCKQRASPSRWACLPAVPPSCGATPRCWGCPGHAVEPAGRSRRHRRSTPPAWAAVDPTSTRSLWPGGAPCRRSSSTRPCPRRSRRRSR